MYSQQMSGCFIALCDRLVDTGVNVLLLVTITVTKVKANLSFNDKDKEWLSARRLFAKTFWKLLERT